MVALTLLTTSFAFAGDTEIAQTIVKQIKQQKADGHLQGFNIGVKVDEGLVWVQGKVANEQQRNLVLSIARNVQGVRHVINAMKVPSNNAAPQSASPVATMASPAGTGVRTASRTMPAVVAPAAPAAPQALRHPVDSRTPVAIAMAPAARLAGRPRAMYVPGNRGMVPARFDQPRMPGYAWPAYAAHPNYAALTYPRQYSPAAWPYIGPFYPYPQVPLGWRSVKLEWDDGWWMLDFKSK
jgi:hypothetical protein